MNHFILKFKEIWTNSFACKCITGIYIGLFQFYITNGITFFVAANYLKPPRGIFWMLLMHIGSTIHLPASTSQRSRKETV